MMCGLIDSTMKVIYCGCTIISQQYVLTAAHCIEGKDITRIGVVVGEHDVTTGNFILKYLINTYKKILSKSLWLQ